MGGVELTKWVPQWWVLTSWERLSISLTKVGMKLVFGGNLREPQESLAWLVLGSERETEKTKKKKMNHVVVLAHICLPPSGYVGIAKTQSISCTENLGLNLQV